MARAALLQRSGKVEEARELYPQVPLRAPDFAEALHRLGMIAHAERRLDEAADYLRAQSGRTGRTFFLFWLGSYQDQGEYGEAGRMFPENFGAQTGFAPAV